MIEIKKLYVKLDNTGTIIGYFKQLTEKAESGKLFKIGCNFDETTDFETAIITNLNENEIEVGKDKFINGELVKGE